MNIEYMKLGDKVFVTSEDGHVSERRINNNVEEVLDCENKLEVLGKILEDDEDRLEVISLLKRFFKKCLIGVPVLILGVFPVFDFITNPFHFESLLSGSIYFGSLLATALATEGVLAYLIKGCNKKTSGLVNKLTECYAEVNKLNNSLYELRKPSVNKGINLDFSRDETSSFVALDDSYNDEIRTSLGFYYDQGVKDYMDKKKKVKVLKK